LIIIPLPKNTTDYKHGGLHWGPYGRAADIDMNHQGVSDEVVALTRRHGKHVARAAKTVAGAGIFAE